MLKRFAVVLALLSCPIVVYGQQNYDIFTEDFESGLGAWAAKVRELPNDNTPLLYDSTGVAPNPGGGDPIPIYGGNAGYPASHAAGFSSDLMPWDGQQPQWLERQWVGALTPGLYDVSLTLDRYVSWEKQTDPWGLGNRVYVLTDSLYDDSQMLYDNNPFPPGSSAVDGVRSSLWVGALPDWSTNGLWKLAEVVSGQLDTTTGNVELRLLMHQKDDGKQTVAWDNIHLVITKVGETTPAIDFTEDWETGMDGWTAGLGGPPDNDTPMLFTTTDSLLYDNVDNPGSQSAGYSSNSAETDFTRGAWLQQQFPAVVPGGETYSVRFEYDCYVYRQMREANDTPALFPASGDGLYGAKTPFGGQVLSQSAGYSSNLSQTDDTSEWLQMQWPALLPAGTYDITLELDLYLYKTPEVTDPYGYGSRLYVLTDQYYDDPGWNFDGGDPYNDVPSKGFRASTWLNSQNGVWARKIISKPGINTTSGNIELRLLSHDKNAGAQSTAWDNLVLTIRPAGGGTPVFVFTEDFESGFGAWTAMADGEVNPGDPWGAGNRMYILTDDQYDDPTWNFDGGPLGGGMEVSYWPGWLNDTEDWSFDGRWQHVVTEKVISTVTGNVEVRLLHHDKNPGPQAVAWDNLSLTLTRLPPPCGDVRFDRDADGDVDQVDFAVNQICYTGDGDPAGMFDSAACKCLDSDNDLDIDQVDLQAFEACAVAPGVASDIACDDSLPPPLP